MAGLINARLVARSAIEYGYLSVIPGGTVYWTERRPGEGRTVLVRAAAGAAAADVLPAPWSAGSSVHEYGGRPYVVAAPRAATADEVVYFSEADSHRLHRLVIGRGEPTPISPPALPDEDARFVAPILVDNDAWLVCVRETHRAGGVAHDIVAVATEGSGEVVVLASGRDFYGAPAISPDGRQLAWTCWDHPAMPWDHSEVWIAELRPGPTLAWSRRLAGGTTASASHPQYSPAGRLTFVSDAGGWQQLYAETDGAAVRLADDSYDIGLPEWMAGEHCYAFVDRDIVAVATRDGTDCLVRLSDGSATLTTVPTPYTWIAEPQAHDGAVYAIAGGPLSRPEVIRVAPGGRVDVIHPAPELGFSPELISAPQLVITPTDEGMRVHSFYYAPTHSAADAAPPLVVNVHGGPTLRASNLVNPEVLFWTSRGFGYLDVNYRGSAGFGRSFRRALYGRWGLADVVDCTRAAGHVVSLGLADPGRMAIRGRSAGGYTALMALATGDTFHAGASYWGVTDLARLQAESHDFEVSYIGTLAGAPGDLDRADRSPVHLAQQIRTPVAVFQGSDDRVVPLSQAESLIAALRANEIDHTYLVFDHEGHGLRHAENAARALEAEWFLYARAFGLALPADAMPSEIGQQ